MGDDRLDFDIRHRTNLTMHATLRIEDGRLVGEAVPVNGGPDADACDIALTRIDESPKRLRYFVLVVVGKDAITFEGRRTSWEGLPDLLARVPGRRHTVLAFAFAPKEVPSAQRVIMGRLESLRKLLGFEYVSYVGTKPLGSKGDPAHLVLAPASQPAS